MVFVIASGRNEYKALPENLRKKTGHEFSYIDSPGGLAKEALDSLNPEYVFFPHWSSPVPADIYENFQCVMFHMTDLPYGRGGSPLQNLIAAGVYRTRMTAFRCVKEVDAGPVYLKRPFTLDGPAREIFRRAADLIEDMIIHIIERSPAPVPQEGEVVTFKRRSPEDSDISSISDPRRLYDHIRMLDADGYPPAFLETNGLRMEFSGASLQEDCVLASVKITSRRP